MLSSIEFTFYIEIKHLVSTDACSAKAIAHDITQVQTSNRFQTRLKVNLSSSYHIPMTLEVAGVVRSHFGSSRQTTWSGQLPACEPASKDHLSNRHSGTLPLLFVFRSSLYATWAATPLFLRPGRSGRYYHQPLEPEWLRTLRLRSNMNININTNINMNISI